MSRPKHTLDSNEGEQNVHRPTSSRGHSFSVLVHQPGKGIVCGAYSLGHPSTSRRPRNLTRIELSKIEPGLSNGRAK